MLLARTIHAKALVRPCFLNGCNNKLAVFGMFSNNSNKSTISSEVKIHLLNSTNFSGVVADNSSYSAFTSLNSINNGALSVRLQLYMQQRYLHLTSCRLNEKEDDDLQAILKDKSLGIFQKFKIVFRQYGAVMIVVHLLTSVVWVAIFYYAASRGFDVTPLLERWGIFDLLEKWGFSYAEKLKSSGASDYVVTYAMYEIAKPIRYFVTLFATMYAVKYLRRRGLMKLPPKSAKVSDLMQTQSKIMRNRFRKTTKVYSDKYKKRLHNRRKKPERNGIKPGNNGRFK